MPEAAPTAKSLIAQGLEDHLAGRLVAAEVAYRRALVFEPKNHSAHYNLGLILQASKRIFEAEAHYRLALQRNPKHAQSWNNLGNVLRDTRRIPESVECFRRAIALKPDHQHARTNLALALLSMGKYTEAWPLWEDRFAAKAALLPELACPALPHGQSLEGCRLLLVAEQGYGDSVQLIRYAPLLRERGLARLSVLCRPALAPLLATCEGVDEVLEKEGSHDFHMPMLSLPGYFGTTMETIPTRLPYLRAQPGCVERWRQRLPAGKRYVGLTWQGNADHGNDAQRSIRLEQLKPLWQTPGVTFVSLQKGWGEEAAAHPPDDQPLLALGSEMDDFGDLAALVSLMDLVISVDTALVHVAGAIGKACWVLIPALGCDWRWFGAAQATQAPWYPEHLRLFHQPGGGDWTPVMHGLPARLHATLNGLRA
jgi:hypothetical protein